MKYAMGKPIEEKSEKEPLEPGRSRRRAKPRREVLDRCRTLVDLSGDQVEPSPSPEEIEAMKLQCASFAGYLVPLAQAHANSGKWSREVAAWLIMIRDSFGQKSKVDIH